MEEKKLLEEFAGLVTPNGGIESFVSENTPQQVVDRLSRLDEEPLSKVQLD